jgi:glycine dehydrogenase
MTAHRKHTDEPATNFARRHIGPSPRDIDAMLETVGAKSLNALMGETLPSSIRQRGPMRSAKPRRSRIWQNSPRRTRYSLR